MASKKTKVSYRWFPDEYWKRPDLRKDGDSDRGQKLFQAVGAALTAWENAEEMLAAVFVTMMECSNGQHLLAARRAYGSIESNTGRRKAIVGVAEVYFGRAWSNDEIQKPTINLIENISSAAKLRDDVAHGKAVEFQVNQKRYGTFLVPVEYNNSRTFASIQNDGYPLNLLRGRYRYVADDVIEIKMKFEHLFNAIWEFNQLIDKKKAFWPLIWKFHPERKPPTSKATQ